MLLFKNWYLHKYGKDLASNTYVQVKHAIQGHPEAPRLWQTHIDSILKDIGFQCTHHEPCIYMRNDKVTSETQYMLR